MSLQKDFAKALEKRGSRRVMDARSTKYWVYTRHPTKSGQPSYYYLGKGGALRIGTTTANSIPCSQQFRLTLLAIAHGRAAPDGGSDGSQPFAC